MKPRAYFDTSAVVKLYVDEPGSSRLLRLAGRHRPVCSVILSMEMASAVARRWRVGDITWEARDTVLHNLQEDLPLFDLVELSLDVRQRAETALLAYPLRTLDAIHIASALFISRALSLPRMPFITSDQRQCEGAALAGLDAILVLN